MKLVEPVAAEAKPKVVKDYLDELLSAFFYIDFCGIAQLERVVSIELDAFFVPLKAIPLAGGDRGNLGRWQELLTKMADKGGQGPERKTLEAA